MIGFIASMVAWYVLKGDTVMSQETTNISERFVGRNLELLPSINKPERWWREPYGNKGTFEKSSSHEFSERVKQNIMFK